MNDRTIPAQTVEKLLETILLIFSAACLLEIKYSRDAGDLTTDKAMALYARIGRRVEDSITKIEHALAAKQAEAELRPHGDPVAGPRAPLITLQHPEDHHHGDASLPGDTAPPKAPTAP